MQIPLILTKNTSFEDQISLKAAKDRGAYSALLKALMTSKTDLMNEVDYSGLCGRGGAGFLTAKKWRFLNKTKPCYLIANADESEIGTFKDRFLLEHDPHLVIEGIIIAAYILGANWACIYLRGEYTKAYLILKQAISDCYADGLLGKSVLGSTYSLDLIIHRGAGAYICGEESAQLNSLEGIRPNPRFKPPFPAESGLYGFPTVVNNVETLANIPWIIKNGGSSFAEIGTEESKGTKLIAASGAITKSGVYEIALGDNLLNFIDNYCDGIKSGKKIKAVFTGGVSVSILKYDELINLNFSYESLKSAGSALGCGGLIVFDETVSMLEVAKNLVQFYQHESCGLCSPCREGWRWLKQLLNASSIDVDLILDVCDKIKANAYCGLGMSGVLPIKSILTKFRSEF